MDITNIITTVIGGMLTIIGGFLGVFLTQYINNRSEKRKLIREKTEELHLLINDIEAKIMYFAASSTFHPIDHIEINKNARLLFMDLINQMNKIEMIVNIYAQDAQKEVYEYC